MSVELSETEVRLPKGLIKMQYHRQGGVMDVRTNKNSAHFLYKSTTTPLVDGKKIDLRRSYSHGNNRKMFKSSYFSLESMLLLICLATSLLILPLILPPLPPPPFMLLLLPIGILALLLILAFMPSDIRDISQTSM